jgi:hypothetical protein
MDLYEESQKSEGARILNALDLPMGGIDVGTTAQYLYEQFSIDYTILKMISRSLATNQTAWQQTRGLKGFVRDNPPVDDLIWGTATLAGATSWVHMDANGLATHVQIVNGAKYWVIFKTAQGNLPLNEYGNLSSINSLPPDWEPWYASQDIFEHEGLLLTPGDLL